MAAKSLWKCGHDDRREGCLFSRRCGCVWVCMGCGTSIKASIYLNCAEARPRLVSGRQVMGVCLVASHKKVSVMGTSATFL